MGSWKPQWTYLAALLFGFLDALQFRIQAAMMGLPVQFLQMVPYLGAIAVLVLASRWKRKLAPEALGVPYIRGQR